MLTTTQAAARLGLTRAAITNAIRRGTLAATKTGRDWLLEEAEVARYRTAPRDKGGRPRQPRP